MPPHEITLSVTLAGDEADAFEAWRRPNGGGTAEDAVRRLIAQGLVARSRRRQVGAEDEARSGPEAPAGATGRTIGASRTG